VDHFICVDCQTKHWSIANPQQCGRCGGDTIAMKSGTDAPSMLHYIQAEMIEEAIERDVIEGIAAIELRLAAEGEMDKYGVEGKDLP
jgi:hypothetical protein